MSSRMPCSASMMASASAEGRMCCAPSIAACAMLPVMSSRYMRLSKRMEELKSSATGSVTPAVRPAHIFAMVMVSLHALSPQRTASLGSLWKSCGSLQRTRHARTFASRTVFSPPYTPPEKMIGISLRLRAQTLRGFWNDLPAPGGPARGENLTIYLLYRLHALAVNLRLHGDRQTVELDEAGGVRLIVVARRRRWRSPRSTGSTGSRRRR